MHNPNTVPAISDERSIKSHVANNDARENDEVVSFCHLF
jgi:hypothetical protein